MPNNAKQEDHGATSVAIIRVVSDRLCFRQLDSNSNHKRHSTTATLDLTFSFVGTPTESDPLDVGSVTVTPVGSTTGDVNTIALTVENAYPGYEVTVGFRIKNMGTIPAKFVGFNLNSGPTSYSNVNGWSANLPGGELTFQAFDGEGEMVPVGGSHTYSLELDVTTAAQSGTTYTFTVGVVFEQGA